MWIIYYYAHTNYIFTQCAVYLIWCWKICNFILGNDKVKEGKDKYVHLNC